MKKLLANQRTLNPIGALVGFAVICLCLGSLGLTLDYRGQLSTTRDDLNRTASIDAELQGSAWQACVLRNRNANLINSIETADIDLQRTMIKAELANPFVSSVVRQARVSAYRKKMAADMRYLAAPPVDCSRLKPKTVTDSSRGR